MEEDNRFRSLERFAREIMEAGTLGVGRTLGNRGVAFRGHSHSSTDSGLKVGAKRNQAHEREAAEKAEENKRNREQEVQRREKEAEKRRKESEQRSARMANEEMLQEGAYSKSDTDSLKGIHQRLHSSISHPSMKNVKYGSSHAFASAVDKEYQVRKELKKRGINVEKPKHSSVFEDVTDTNANTEKRIKVVNVARPNDAAPTSEKSKLTKQAEIKTKVLEGESEMLTHDKRFGLSDSLIAAAKSIMEKKDDVLKGDKTEVDLEPKTDDTVEPMDDGDKKSKKSEKKCDECGKPISKCDCDDHDHDDDGDKKSKKSMKEEAEGTTPRTAKEKKLAALSSPKDKITHKDVLVGRGVIAKEELSSDELDAVAEIAASISMDEEITDYNKSKSKAGVYYSGGTNHITNHNIDGKNYKVTSTLGNDGEHYLDVHHGDHELVQHSTESDDEIHGPKRIMRSQGRKFPAEHKAAVTKAITQHFNHPDIRKALSNLNGKRGFGRKLDEDFEMDEAKRRNVPDRQTVTSSPIRGANQDQSGHGVSRNVADYNISDEYIGEVAKWRKGPEGKSWKKNPNADADDYEDEKEYYGSAKEPNVAANKPTGSVTSSSYGAKRTKAAKQLRFRGGYSIGSGPKGKLPEEFEIDEDQLDEARGRPRLPRDAQGKVIRDPAAIAAHRASTDTKQAESPHIIDQLRGVVSSGGKRKVTFKSGETKQIGVNHAKAGLLVHHAAGKPADKSKMATRMWHSHDSFMSALRGEPAAEPKVKRAGIRGSTTLPQPKSLEKPISAMSASTIKRTAKAFADYRANKNK